MSAEPTASASARPAGAAKTALRADREVAWDRVRQTQANLRKRVGKSGRAATKSRRSLETSNYQRWYRPNDGRYLSPDPIGLAGGEAGYSAYAGGNPLVNSDRSGRKYKAPHGTNCHFTTGDCRDPVMDAVSGGGNGGGGSDDSSEGQSLAGQLPGHEIEYPDPSCPLGVRKVQHTQEYSAYLILYTFGLFGREDVYRDMGCVGDMDLIWGATGVIASPRLRISFGPTPGQSNGHQEPDEEEEDGLPEDNDHIRRGKDASSQRERE